MSQSQTIEPLKFVVSDRDREMAERWWKDTLDEPVTSEEFSDLWILCNLLAQARAEGRLEGKAEAKVSDEQSPADQLATIVNIEKLARLAWTTWASGGNDPQRFDAKWDVGSERWKDDWRLVARVLVQEINNG